MDIKIKKLHKDAVIPKYAKQGDACLDLIATTIDLTDNYIEYKTGIALEIPTGYVGLIYPRSSISNMNLILSNSVGVIDSGYRGEITFRYKYFRHNKDSKSTIYCIGERIGQILIIPYPTINFIEVEELSDSERGSNGYGSTGK